MRRLAGIATACVIGLIAAECVLRLTMSMTWSSATFVNDPDLGFRMRAGVDANGESTNSRGYNDADHAMAKPDGTVRVAFVGDSYVFGVGPRASNATAVVQNLADAAGARIEVLNMGLPGAGPRNYVGILRKDAADAQVDLAVVVLFLGNDLIQAHPDFDTRIWLGDVRAVLVRPWAIGPSSDYVSVYRLVRNTARVLHERFVAHEGTYSQSTFEDVEWQRAVVFAQPPSAFVRTAYAGLIDAVRAMQAVARERNISLAIVVAPDQIQVERSLRDEVASRFGADLRDYDFEAVSDRLVRDVAAQGIPTLDLLPVLRHAAESESLFALRDTHWNAAGNAVAGAAMWRFVSEVLAEEEGVEPTRRDHASRRL